MQIANLYITQLHIRSNILEQSDGLAKGQSGLTTSQSTLSRRQSLAEDFLEILSHVPREILEANGHSLVPKIRDIGAALPDKVKTINDSQPANEQTRTNLKRLSEKLEKLEFQAQVQSFGTGKPMKYLWRSI